MIDLPVYSVLCVQPLPTASSLSSSSLFPPSRAKPRAQILTYRVSKSESKFTDNAAPCSCVTGEPHKELIAYNIQEIRHSWNTLHFFLNYIAVT